MRTELGCIYSNLLCPRQDWTVQTSLLFKGGAAQGRTPRYGIPQGGSGRSVADAHTSEKRLCLCVRPHAVLGCRPTIRNPFHAEV
jgi:hypothetical protein